MRRGKIELDLPYLCRYPSSDWTLGDGSAELSLHPCLKQPLSGTIPKSPICVDFWHEVSLLHPSELHKCKYTLCDPERCEESSWDHVHFCHETATGPLSLWRRPLVLLSRNRSSSPVFGGDCVHFRGETASGHWCSATVKREDGPRPSRPERLTCSRRMPYRGH